jgi:heme-degrading monooxygenase HmoA
MHARMTILVAKPGKLDELERIGRTSGVSSAEEQPGFGALLLLKDPEANRAINITIWNSEAEMLSGENNGYLQEQLDKVASLLVEPPIIQHYEVSVLS